MLYFLLSFILLFQFLNAAAAKYRVSMSESEVLFERFLERQKITFSKNSPVNSHNVDFRLVKSSNVVLSDVKEVRDPEVKLSFDAEKINGWIDAQEHIRGDIKKLRQKFHVSPLAPLILVSMNFSSNTFTALTVSRALMGEIGIIYERWSEEIVSELQHLHIGNASITKNKNRSISGVLMFDVVGDDHYLFRSPYANYHVPLDFFDSIRVIDLKKDETPEEIIELTKITFWARNAI